MPRGLDQDKEPLERVLDQIDRVIRSSKPARAALADAALAQEGMSYVEIHHDKANEASAAVARKLGFWFTGEQRGEAGAPGESGIEWRWRIDNSSWRQT